jgi:hypothetical protein
MLRKPRALVALAVAVAALGGAVSSAAADGAPPNDNVADAQEIGGPAGSVAGTTALATTEPNERTHDGSVTPNDNGHSIWFRWTAPATGTVYFTTAGSSYDAPWGVYTGTSIADLHVTGGWGEYVNPWSTLRRTFLRVTAGGQYLIAIDGTADGVTGPVQLNWRMTVPGDDTTQPSLTSVAPDPGATVRGVVEFAADASDEVAVDRVEFAIMPNGSNDPPWLIAEDLEAPYTTSLDTSVLADGLYSVFMTVYDTSDNSFSTGFTVTVDNVPAPTLSLPGNIVAEATRLGGANVQWKASAVDAHGNPVAVACTPKQGSFFPLGQTRTVRCTARDATGQASTGTFTVTVVDTTAPSLVLPSSLVLDATGPDGAAVSYGAAATDIASGDVAATCSPASGATLPIGDTTVACSAVDASGNRAHGTFTVHVKGVTEQLRDLRAYLAASGLPEDERTKLDRLLARAESVPPCGPLADFSDRVAAKQGKTIAADVAAKLLADASRIAAVASCGS